MIAVKTVAGASDPDPAPAAPELVLMWEFPVACIPTEHVGGDRWHTRCRSIGQEFDVRILREWCIQCPVCHGTDQGSVRSPLPKGSSAG